MGYSFLGLVLDDWGVYTSIWGNQKINFDIGDIHDDHILQLWKLICIIYL